jgi:trimethylamine--corrinoid protein Co-methyltransferase
MAGATAPVTLAGAVVQHAAECISGIVIHQLTNPGAPVVWGGAPSIVDMSTGMTPMGSVETAMLDIACAQVGKYLGLPTHGYLVSSDGKAVDVQAGMESGTSAALGALAGINMISGAGMLDFLSCQSVEKLVIDAEAIASAQRLIRGIEPRGESLATAMFAQVGLNGDFLRIKETRTLFRSEQHFPSSVIDRGNSLEGGSNIFQRARDRADELLTTYRRPKMPADREESVLEFATRAAADAGSGSLPGISQDESALPQNASAFR